MSKREHIISKAIELFAEWGFDNTSIRAISQKAGVNVAMINYYFGSKEKLFEAIIDYKSSYLKSRLEELRANLELNELDKIKIIIDEFTNRIMSNPKFHRILHQELLLNTRPELNTIIRGLFQRNYSIIKSILEDGIRKKLFRQVDADLTIATVFGTINHLAQSANMLISGQDVSKEFQFDEPARQRLVSHLHNLMEAHLLNKA